jgi:hypothetical protein
VSGTSDQDQPTSTRRGPIVAVVVLVVLAAVGLGWWALSGDDDAGDTATAAAEQDTGTTGAEAGSDRTDPGATDPAAGPEGAPDGGAEPAPPVELAPVAGGSEAELCAAIVARLGEYRAVAADGGVDQTLLDALDEFEAQIDTQSDDQDWGDRIIEALTNVRREWVTALSAQDQGDEGEADERFDAALGHLDRAIDDAGCPTA